MKSSQLMDRLALRALTQFAGVRLAASLASMAGEHVGEIFLGVDAQAASVFHMV
jgi:hypothetical protein